MPEPIYDERLQVKRFPPTQTVTLDEFRRSYPDRGVEYRLVCDVCKFGHGGTEAARSRPPWVLVTWTCHSCRESWVDECGRRGLHSQGAAQALAVSGAPISGNGAIAIGRFFSDVEREAMYRECEGNPPEKSEDIWDEWTRRMDNGNDSN